MSNPTEEFQNLWNTSDAVGNVAKVAQVRQSIMQRARDPQQESVRAQRHTVLILLTVIAVLVLMFQYVSPVEQLLATIGKYLMIGSIALRVTIELVGLALARKIDFFDSTTDFVKKSQRLIRFRTRVHKYVVIATFALYSIGYYMLMPEWSLYFTSVMIWILIVSYVFIMAAVILLFIRPGMQREKAALIELEKLTNDLDQEYA